MFSTSPSRACGSSSGKVFGHEMDIPGSIPGVEWVEIFLHSFVSRLVLGSSQPPIRCVPGGLCPGVKVAEHRTSHPTSSWLYIRGCFYPQPPMGLHGLYLLPPKVGNLHPFKPLPNTQMETKFT